MKTNIIKFNKLINCKVQVTTTKGVTHIYYRSYRSTADAVLHAIERFNIAGILVKAL